jgi:two-component system, response regulator YesN
MPIMDGLELIQAVRQQHPDIQIVVLSAYDEFHMVSSAFKLGASEYFLKAELQPDSVSEVLLRLKERIVRGTLERKQQQEREREVADSRAKTQDLERTLSVNREALQERFLINAIAGRPLEDSTRQLLDLGLRLRPGLTRAMVISASPVGPGSAGEGFAAAVHFSLPGTIRNVLEARRLGDLLAHPDGEFIVLTSSNGVSSGCRGTGEMHTLFHEIQAAAASRCHITLSGGLSEAGAGLEALPVLCRHAATACRFAFVAGRGRLIDFETLPQTALLPFDSQEQLRRLNAALACISGEEAEQSAAEVTIPKHSVAQGCVEDAKRVFAQYHCVLSEYARRHSAEDAIAALLLSYETWFRDHGDLDECNGWAESCLTRLSNCSGETKRVVRLAKKYILKNFANDITLAMLSAELGISAGYISRVFAREAGCTFVEFLAKVRIGEAQRLMAETNLKFYEISERVGLANPEYFSRLFKKIVGKSPKDYNN